jgi:uncharacterized surface protein with fasciclin (FAS1) repeats
MCPSFHSAETSSHEFNSSLYTVFVDFTKAFDSLDREVLCQLMRHYGIPEKFIAIIRNTVTDA